MFTVVGHILSTDVALLVDLSLQKRQISGASKRDIRAFAYRASATLIYCSADYIDLVYLC